MSDECYIRSDTLSDERRSWMSGAVEEFEIVVVGAGPGGLASAVTLGSYGVDTLVVEQRHSPSRLPRANTASTGTMELLRRWGLEEAARERSIDVHMQPLAVASLAAAPDGHTVEAGFPTREQAALISPTGPMCLGQDELEPLLEERLGSFTSTRLERGVELTVLEPGAGGGQVLTLVGPGERRRQVRARYVIGADGMHSTVREELGIAREGTETIEERLAIHFRAPLWDLVGERRYGIYFITAEPEDRVFLPIGKPDRWAFGRRWDSAVDDVDALTAEQMQDWIRDAAGVPDLPIEIERSSVFGYGIGLAERFRKGDAFLIGDAAHRVTPRGATGLNTAIRDGFDIGWKLGWVLRGWAGARLLESYERERRPVAEFNTQRSTRTDGSILGNSIGLNADIGGRIAHVWVPRAGGPVSTLDLLGDGLTLFVGPNWHGALPRGHAGSPPLTVERLDALAARGLGLTTVGALLARPDGYPVALWNDDGSVPARLTRAIAAANGSAVGTASVLEPVG
jgi:2-polyprenyl-6-methoxyphenol hydroxylase-like FAD-dependent oxidoreductase